MDCKGRRLYSVVASDPDCSWAAESMAVWGSGNPDNVGVHTAALLRKLYVDDGMIAAIYSGGFESGRVASGMARRREGRRAKDYGSRDCMDVARVLRCRGVMPDAATAGVIVRVLGQGFAHMPEIMDLYMAGFDEGFSLDKSPG